MSRSNHLTIIGVPSSAGAYAPGQEQGPAAMRAAGLSDALRARGVDVRDHGDTPGFRWQVDRSNLRAQNANAVARIARATADAVAGALTKDAAALILGGDCTIELGTVAGALAASENIGLVYIDHDTDLNTPASTRDGALDWMGVAHLLGIDNTVPKLCRLGPRTPMLRPEQILFFAHENVMPFEREIIDRCRIAEVPLAEVLKDPVAAGHAVATGWARRFDRVLVHLDVDVLDFLDLPLAENTRRENGLRLDQLMAALRPLVHMPQWSALTITELNPDHGEADGSTVRRVVDALADVLAPQ
jgi:arginase